LWAAEKRGQGRGFEERTDGRRLNHVADGEPLDGLVLGSASRAVGAPDGLDVAAACEFIGQRLTLGGAVEGSEGVPFLLRPLFFLFLTILTVSRVCWFSRGCVGEGRGSRNSGRWKSCEVLDPLENSPLGNQHSKCGPGQVCQQALTPSTESADPHGRVDPCQKFNSSIAAPQIPVLSFASAPSQHLQIAEEDIVSRYVCTMLRADASSSSVCVVFDAS
jgi:hypothetical protein